ncbi:hypothetical protein R0011_11295 [Lacticaseibacillus rhamnosus R0011]|nr:hypothetical protein R0011_11295 [Lacticaseibacillus rhamnosus R0011]
MKKAKTAGWLKVDLFLVFFAQNVCAMVNVM